MNIRDVTATASSVCEILAAIEYDQIMVGADATGAVDAAIDLDAFTGDGFRLIVDDTTGAQTAQYIGYLTFGDAMRSVQNVYNVNQAVNRASSY